MKRTTQTLAVLLLSLALLGCQRATKTAPATVPSVPQPQSPPAGTESSPNPRPDPSPAQPSPPKPAPTSELLTVDLNGDGRSESISIKDSRLLVTADDGKTLVETKPERAFELPDRVKAEILDLPGRPPLVQVGVNWCFQGGRGSLFVWYDPKAEAFRSTPELDCNAYHYTGNGQFDVFGGIGTALYNRDRVHWANGQFVTDHREYSLVLRWLYPHSLARVLRAVASGKVIGEELLFAKPELLAEFKSRTGQGDWDFTDAVITEGQIVYKVSRGGQPQGQLTVRTAPPENLPDHMVVGPGSFQIVGLTWSTLITFAPSEIGN